MSPVVKPDLEQDVREIDGIEVFVCKKLMKQGGSSEVTSGSYRVSTPIRPLLCTVKSGKNLQRNRNVLPTIKASN